MDKGGLVVHVPFEERLDAVPPKQELVLIHRVGIFPVCVIHVLLVEIVLGAWWHIGRYHLFVVHRLPLEGGEPGVLLDFVVSVETQSVRRFALETLYRGLLS